MPLSHSSTHHVLIHPLTFTLTLSLPPWMDGWASGNTQSIGRPAGVWTYLGERETDKENASSLQSISSDPASTGLTGRRLVHSANQPDSQPLQKALMGACMSKTSISQSVVRLSVPLSHMVYGMAHRQGRYGMQT